MCYGIVIPREKGLRGVRQVDLSPDEEKTVVFHVPFSAFILYNDRMHWVLEPGWFQIMTGPDAESLQAARIAFR